MSLTLLTLVPLLFLIGWLVTELRGRTWIRIIAGLAALVTIAIMAFLWGGFVEAFKHAEFQVPHDSPAQAAQMDAADKSAANSASVFTYTAKITNGQVFLSLNASPDQMIGPFAKKSDDTYTCETEGKGVHSLTRSSTGDWSYSWSHIQMRPESVDGSGLAR
ncbi:MAG: hypothetical protein JWR26_4081 [Pedosphaera sp.]|nr:hypothetical protein [Pedosphaera sp.]